MNYKRRTHVDAERLNTSFIEAEQEENRCRLFVLIHGFMSSSYSFRPLIPELSPYGSVLTFDLPGFGASEKQKHYRYSYQQFAETIATLVANVSDQPIEVVPIGHSMGGQIALRLSLMMKEEISKVILLASSGNLPKSPYWLRLATYLPFFSKWLSRFIRKRDVRKVLEQVVYDQRLVTEEQVEAYRKPLENPRMYQALTKFIRHREGDFSREELQKIDTPSLLVWGEKDRIVPLRVGEMLSSTLPNAELLTFAQAGHLLSEEMPKTLAKEILSFLNDPGKA